MPTTTISRFIQVADYDMQIKGEIRRLLSHAPPTGGTGGGGGVLGPPGQIGLGGGGNPPPPSLKLWRAEDTAMEQVRSWLSGRYDCDAIFTLPVAGEPDGRNQFIVTTVIDMALYHLYSQTGNKDVPEHRKERYADALEWLKLAGRGDISSNLPSLINEDSPGSARLWSRPAEDQRW